MHTVTNADGKEIQYVPVYAVEAQVETYLLGKVLTIVDASYPDTEQRDAVKSLIKEKFHSQLDWLLDRRMGVQGSDVQPDVA